jgi:hypothetical protein
MVTLKEVGLGSARAAYDAHNAAGGVVHYAVFAPDEPDDLDAVHRAAVAAGIDRITTDHDAAVAARCREFRVKQPKPMTPANQPSRATSTRVAPAEFVGPFYDFDRRRLVPAMVDGPNETSSKAGAPSGFMTWGYADAFTDTPYGMKADLDDMTHWFNAINDAFLDGLSDRLDIRSWSTDWSKWFDAGNEWWGSIFATIWNPALELVVVVAASTTD